MFVNEIHGGYDGADVRGVTREKQGRVFEDLE